MRLTPDITIKIARINALRSREVELILIEGKKLDEDAIVLWNGFGLNEWDKFRIVYLYYATWILGNMTRKIKECFKIKRFQCLARNVL